MNKSVIYRLVVLFLLVLLAEGLSAGRYVKIFLMPRFTPGEGKVLMRDITRIDSGSEESELIYNIPVNREFFSDGYIDRKEISKILSNRFKGNFFIYGNAVKIVNAQPVENNNDLTKTFAILKGNNVKIIVKKGNLKIEIFGVSRSNGMVGDKVRVLTANRKVISGKIIGRNLVEISL